MHGLQLAGFYQISANVFNTDCCHDHLKSKRLRVSCVLYSKLHTIALNYIQSYLSKNNVADVRLRSNIQHSNYILRIVFECCNLVFLHSSLFNSYDPSMLLSTAYYRMDLYKRALNEVTTRLYISTLLCCSPLGLFYSFYSLIRSL